MIIRPSDLDLSRQYSSAPAFAAEGEPNLKHVFGTLQRRKGIIVTAVTLVTSVALLFAHSLTPQYAATARLIVDPRESRIVPMEAVADGLSRQPAAMETQIRLMASRDLAERIVTRLDLLRDSEFNPALREDGWRLAALVVDLPGRTADLLPGDWLIAAGLATQETETEAVEKLMPVEAQRTMAVEAVLDHLVVRQDGDSHVIAITAQSADPRTAARMANTAAELHVEEHLQRKLSATHDASAWLGKRLQGLREQVRAAERAIEALRAEHGFVVADGGRLDDQQLLNLQSQLITVRAERAHREALLSLARDLRSRGDMGVTEVVSSVEVGDLRSQVRELSRQAAQLSLEFGERHPRRMQLQAEIEAVQERLHHAIDSIVRNLENEVAFARSRERAVEQGLADAQGLSAGARQTEVELRQLEREAEAARVLYTTYLQRFQEAREQVDLVEPDVRVVSSAVEPEVPIRPNMPLIAGGGFFVSLTLGVMLAFLVDRLDSGLRSGHQVEASLGLASLGLVPKLPRLGRHQKLHQYLRQRTRSAYAEALQGVFMALQRGAPHRPRKVVLITSALPGEGKTTFAVGLAVIAASTGARTLLIDLDLRHPSIRREFMCDTKTGLVELLSGQERFEDVVLRDENHPRLEVLPLHGLAARPADLLRSPRLRELLDKLRPRYDIILLDTAPVLGLTDAKIAAALVDRVVFVLQWGKTTVDVARNALEEMLDLETDVVGFVLTQVNLKRHARYGYGDAGQYYALYKDYYID